MGGFLDWSTTPASNASVGAMNWAEGQPPATVNNSARQMAADLRYELGAISSTVSAGATVDLGAIQEGSIVLSGNATISSFGTTANAGLRKKIRLTGAPTIVHTTAAIICPGSASITGAAGDTFDVECESSGVYRIRNYQKADGSPIGSVTNSKLAQMAAGTVKGNNSATVGAVTDLTIAQLQSISGWGQPYFSAYRATNQSISAGALTKIQFATENFDSAGAYDNVTNYRFTPLVAGKYRVTLAVKVNVTPAIGDQTIVGIYKNNGIVNACDKRATSTSLIQDTFPVSAIIDMNGSTDYVEGFVTPITAATVIGGPSNSWFEASFIGP